MKQHIVEIIMLELLDISSYSYEWVKCMICKIVFI